MGNIIRAANYDEKKISLTACENKCDATLKKKRIILSVISSRVKLALNF